ncbi:MAG TPA: glycosyltransferase family 4 protein [candidate division Zixibacteria bacterium]
MRIMMVNWGWPPRQTGGPIGYATDLCKDLVKSGHRVYMFYGGDSNFKGKCYLEYREEEGVNLASLVNSPNQYSNFGLPLNECKQPTVEHFFEEFLDKVKPDLVHFHSLIGLSGSLMEIAKKRGIRTIISLHNYWFICPRGDFLALPDYRLCPGPNGGLNCAICIPPAAKIWKRKIDNLKSIIKTQFKKNIWLKRKLQKILLSTNRFKNILTDSQMEGRETFPAVSALDPLLVWGYKFRQEYLRDQLSKNADLIIAVSNAVKDVFVQNGISEKKIMVLHSGIKMAEKLEAYAEKNYIKPRNPIIFGFFGPVQPYKGVHILVEAFNKLPLGSARLLINGTGPSHYYQSLMRKANSYVEFKGAFDDLAQMLSEFDVAVVPPIWQDNAPLVVLEALSAKKPIIGANIGGIPDFVQDGLNGLLFEAGNSSDLAEKMRKITESLNLIEIFKRNIKKQKTMKEHTKEMEVIYQNLLSEGILLKEDKIKGKLSFSQVQ